MVGSYKRASMDTFFTSHPVFRLDELRAYRNASGAPGGRSEEALLHYYQQTGRIESIRRGVYAAIPRGSADSRIAVDPLLIAGRCVPDSVIVNHSALEFHGLAYSNFQTVTFQTRSTTRRFHYHGNHFVPLSPPGALKHTINETLETIDGERFGMSVTITSIERTVVDVINAPRWSGSWEEIWRSLDSIEYVDAERILGYLRALGNATTAARVGWFLDSRREQLMIDSTPLNEIRRMKPSRPVYLDRTYPGSTRFIRDWNLVVPVFVADSGWEEPT